MKIIGIGGSLRANSYVYLALEIARRHVEAQGHEMAILDLRKMHLPFCNGANDYPAYPDVKVLQETFQSAHGVIMASPEYHGSLSGVLKNALDLLDIKHAEGKTFALIEVTGGDLSTNALNTMRLICRHLHAWVIPQQLVIPRGQEVFSAEGEMIDQKLKLRIGDLVDHLILATERLSSN